MSANHRSSDLARFHPPPFQLDAATDLGEDDDARPHLLDSSAGNHRTTFGWAHALAKLGNDVRVEQEFHRLTLRQSRWRLVKHSREGLIGAGANTSNAVFTWNGSALSSGANCVGPFGPATQRLGQRSDRPAFSAPEPPRVQARAAADDDA
jgi:hypothetical protein